MDPSPFILDGGLATELEASGFQLQVGTINVKLHRHTYCQQSQV